MVLTPSDVPQNFTLVESRAKNATDVGNLALSSAGNRDMSCVMPDSRRVGSGSAEILQTIALYPEKNIPAVAELIERQERSDNNMTFSNLSFTVAWQLQPCIFRKGNGADNQ